ncbi:MAG: hypothetical protein AB1941_15625, partial [Gemmatimonadota bacterium]
MTTRLRPGAGPPVPAALSIPALAAALRAAGFDPGNPVSLPFTATRSSDGDAPYRVTLSLRGDGEGVQVLHKAAPPRGRGAADPAHGPPH